MLPYDEQKHFIGAKTEALTHRTHEKGALAGKARALTPIPFEDPGYPYHVIPCAGKSAPTCRARRRLVKEIWKGRTAAALKEENKIGPWGGTNQYGNPWT